MIGFIPLSEGTQIALIGAIVTALIAPTWLAWWNSRISKKELKPNGGSSLADQVNRIETKVDNAREVTALNTEKIALVKEQNERRDARWDEIFSTLETKLDDHIEYMREVHDRSNKKERSTDQ